MEARIQARSWLLCSFLAFSSLPACTGSSNLDIQLDNPTFPSAGGEPSGNDALSSSTNFSQKIFDPRSKADPLSGAAFIPPAQVNNYGAVSFSYKLEVPKGRAGVEPQIGLSYSSSGGDGWTGVGWSIGLGAITRTTQYGPLRYDHNDTFTAGGKRLIKVAGPNLSANGVYRAEIEDGSFSRYELTNVESGGTWTVYDKNGGITVYGESAEHRIAHPENIAKVYSWQMSKSVDKNGNYLNVLYDTSEYNQKRVLYLKEIRYTGNNNGFAANQYVRFHLTNRSDSYRSTAPGFPMEMDKLLTRIEMGWDNPQGANNTKLWDYRITYTTSADSERPLIKTIESSRTSTNPVFHYQPAVHQFAWTKVTNIFAGDTEMNPQSTQYFEGDFNGDGISDFCFFNPVTGNWKVVESKASSTGGQAYAFKTYGNKFQGFEGQNKIQFFKGNVTGDYNGDGKSDIAFYLTEKKEFWVAESTGTNFQFRLYGKFAFTTFDIFKAEWFTGDFDGNGISDVVLFDEASGDWVLMTNGAPGKSGGSFQFLKVGNQFKNLYRDDYSAGTANGSPSTRDLSAQGKDRAKVHYFSGDFNGDGRSDFSFYDARSGKWWVGENKLTATGNGLENVTFSIEWKLYKVFTAPQQALFGHDRFSGDFNGDGLTDFLFFDKATGEWWLGKTTYNYFTKDHGIDFVKWSTVPQHKDTTRWIQGDFNGDGRTDVGFYSKDDQNFWIGETTNNGFRYRIYGNLSYGGPDRNRVMEAAPLPQDEVEVKQAVKNYAVNGAATQRLEYVYDGNTSTSLGSSSSVTDRGEMPFVGCFTAADCVARPEMLIYDRKQRKTFFKKYNADNLREISTADLTRPEVTILSQRSAMRISQSSKDEILYYDGSDLNNHIFKTITHTGGAAAGNDLSSVTFGSIPLASFSKTGSATSIYNFDIKESLYLIDQFDLSGNNRLLVFDDQNPTAARFRLFDGSATPPEYTISISTTAFPNGLKNLFQAGTSSANRTNRRQFRFFSGKFTGGATAEVLMVDMRTLPHKFYLGTLSSGNINFVGLAATENLPVDQNEEFPELMRAQQLYNVANAAVFYTTKNNGVLQFHRLTAPSGTLNLVHYNAFGEDIAFNWDFDHLMKPVVTTPNGISTVDFGLGTTFTLTAITPGSTPGYPAGQKIDRPDLYQKVYPFQWLQGDYNGDSKTDIGFFHMKEATWYFAHTTGTVPDLIQKVENGLGGFYEFEYANSTSFDNTGGDGIPDLPMNYKVCVKQTINDGQGNQVYNTYEYQDGFAVSSFQPLPYPNANGGQIYRKETDFFGFSKFTAYDALGSKTISEYNRAPYTALADGAEYFLKNRALNGAIKKSTFIGWDIKEYSRTEYDHKVHTVANLNNRSYYAEQTQVRKYVKNQLTETADTTSTLSGYFISAQTASVVDNYSDAVHAPASRLSTTQFELVGASNQQRPTTTYRLQGTSKEIRTTYTYDAVGRVVREQMSDTRDTNAVRTVENQYDSFGNLVAKQNSSASPARRTEYQYDDRLQQFVALERMITDAAPLTQTIAHNYADGFGQPDTVADANGNKQYFTYDNVGRVIRVEADQSTSFDTGSHKVTLSEFEFMNLTPSRPASAKTIQYTGSGTPNITTLVYKDGLGRELFHVQSALSVAGKRLTKSGKRVYDALGRVIRQSQTDWAQDDELATYRAHAGEKYPTVTEYDPSGRVKKVTSPEAYAGEGETSVSFTYNDPWEVVETHSMGQSKRTIKNARGETLYVTDSATAPTALTTSMAFCYDIAGNRVKRSDTLTPLSVPGGCSIPGNAFTVADASGNNVSYWQFDAWGQNTKHSDPDTGVRSNGYDNFGQLVATTDSMGYVTSMTYDRLGRMTQKNPNGEGMVYYTYDVLPGAANALGKLVAIEDKAQRKEFSYDKLGHRVRENRRLKDSSGNLQNAYLTAYQYDLLDRTIFINYPQDPASGVAIRSCYTYNSFGLVESVSVNMDQSGSGCSAKTIVSSVSYNEFTQMTEFVRGNGIATRYEYDIKGRVSAMRTFSGGGVTELVTTVYTYDKKNNIQTKLSQPTAAAVGSGYVGYNTELEYDYDGLNRLVAARGRTYDAGASSGQTQRTFEHGYGYALNGNLTVRQFYDYNSHNLTDQWNYTYDNHKVTAITSTAFGGTRFNLSYSAAGNTLTKSDTLAKLPTGSGTGLVVKNMAYDSYNRIISVSSTPGPAGAGAETVGTYDYDDQGFRVRKVSKQFIPPDALSPGAGTTRTYELEYPNKYFGVERQKDAAGNIVANTTYSVNNIFLDGVRIAAVVPVRGANPTACHARYFHTDQVDSVHIVTNDNGGAVNRTEYLPFGETWFQEGEKAYAPKFNSQEMDKESGLYFFNARHQDPELGRFETADTVIDGEYSTQGWNRYSYVHNNPVKYKDPTGHEAEDNDSSLAAPEEKDIPSQVNDKDREIVKSMTESQLMKSRERIQREIRDKDKLLKIYAQAREEVKVSAAKGNILAKNMPGWSLQQMAASLAKKEGFTQGGQTLPGGKSELKAKSTDPFIDRSFNIHEKVVHPAQEKKLLESVGYKGKFPVPSTELSKALTPEQYETYAKKRTSLDFAYNAEVEAYRTEKKYLTEVTALIDERLAKKK